MKSALHWEVTLAMLPHHFRDLQFSCLSGFASLRPTFWVLNHWTLSELFLFFTAFFNSLLKLTCFCFSRGTGIWKQDQTQHVYPSMTSHIYNVCLFQHIIFYTSSRNNHKTCRSFFFPSSVLFQSAVCIHRVVAFLCSLSKHIPWLHSLHRQQVAELPCCMHSLCVTDCLCTVRFSSVCLQGL